MWTKLIQWIPKNLTAMLGIVQVVIKFGKEVCTLVIDILGPIIPGDEALVRKIRDIFNALDGWVEKIKSFLLGIGG